MKKIVITSVFCLALAWISASAQAQSQNTCYAYGHHKAACPGLSASQKTISEKEKSEDIKSEKKETVQDKKKYNSSAFKAKHYFFRSL